MAEYAVGIATKNKIYKVSKELFYQKGIVKTSYTDITAAAEVNRGLIPYYFKSKTSIARLAYDELVASMEQVVYDRWDESVDPTVRNVLVELFQFRLLEHDERMLRFFSEIGSGLDFHEDRLEVQGLVMNKMLEDEGLEMPESAKRTISCMMSGTETELIQAMQAGYLTESVEDFVRRDLLWVYFLLGVEPERVNAWCDEAYALAEGLSMESGPDFTCRIVKA